MIKHGGRVVDLSKPWSGMVKRIQTAYGTKYAHVVLGSGERKIIRVNSITYNDKIECFEVTNEG